MTFLGMNIEHVSAQVTRIHQGAQSLDSLTDDLGQTLARSVDFWKGPDAEAFRATWDATASQLRSTGDQLTDRSTELTGHQDEQDAASEGDGASGDAGSDGGDAGGSSAGDPVDKTNEPGEPPYRGTVDPEVAERWESMSKEDREKVAQAMLDEQMERYGMDLVTLHLETDDGNNGMWRSPGLFRGHRIEIDGDRLDDPDLLHTIAHEARHAAQWEAVQDTEDGFWDFLPWAESSDEAYARLEEDHGFTREEIDSWRDHWNASEEDKAPYLDRSVEVDARNAGAEFSDGLTMEDLDRYEEAAGLR